MPPTVVKKPTKRPVGRKETKLNISVSLDLGDVVRVAGWDKANKMLTRCLAFATNKKGRVSLKVKKAKS
jgi:hypothetical protein